MCEFIKHTTLRSATVALKGKGERITVQPSVCKSSVLAASFLHTPEMWLQWLVREDSLRNKTTQWYMPGSLPYVDSMYINVVCRLCTNIVWPKFIFNLNVCKLNMKGNGPREIVRLGNCGLRCRCYNWVEKSRQKGMNKNMITKILCILTY